MTILRIETLVEGDTLYLPELKPLVGKSVEIVVTELPTKTIAGDVGWISPLAGTVLQYTDPLAPIAPDGEWEAAR